MLTIKYESTFKRDVNLPRLKSRASKRRYNRLVSRHTDTAKA